MTTKAQHATALAEHYTRATSPGSHRLDTLEAVAGILGDDTPEEWIAHRDSLRAVADRRAGMQEHPGTGVVAEGIDVPADGKTREHTIRGTA